MPTSTVIPEQDVAGTGAASRATTGPDIADLDATRLVRRAANGDPQAWEGLVGRYGRLIWSITRDFKLVESDAADVFQTTWMRLIEHIDRIDHPDRVGSWLAATARNECLRSLAAHKRVVLAHDDDPFDGQASREPEVELLLVEKLGVDSWSALVKPGKSLAEVEARTEAAARAACALHHRHSLPACRDAQRPMRRRWCRQWQANRRSRHLPVARRGRQPVRVHHRKDAHSR